MSQEERISAASPQGASQPPPAMLPEHPMLFVQSIKGAPASVLLALGFAGRFLSLKELQLWTRCGHAQISLALRSLKALGWVRARTFRGPWALAVGRQLPLQFFLEDASALKARSSSGDSLNTIEREIPLPSARSEHLIQVMYGLGIREPTASELAELPHMTLEYLQAHMQAARAHGLRVGAAIEAMRLEAPAPAKPTPKNRRAEVEEKIRRFREGN